MALACAVMPNSIMVVSNPDLTYKGNPGDGSDVQAKEQTVIDLECEEEEDELAQAQDIVPHHYSVWD